MQSVKENGQTEMEAGAFWEKQGFLRQEKARTKCMEWMSKQQRTKGERNKKRDHLEEKCHC